MSIETIKDSLTHIGYYTSLNATQYLTVARKASDEDPGIIRLADLFCRIYPKESQIMVLIFGPQIPDERYFDTESQVVAFIKNQFPL